MLESLFNGNLLKETSTQVISCEICKIFKNTHFYRKPPVAAFVVLLCLVLLLILLFFSVKFVLVDLNYYVLGVNYQL